MGEIFGLASKFSLYSMTQLNELLEDDDKLTEIVKEMDEVSTRCQQIQPRFLFGSFLCKTSLLCHVFISLQMSCRHLLLSILSMFIDSTWSVDKRHESELQKLARKMVMSYVCLVKNPFCYVIQFQVYFCFAI